MKALFSILLSIWILLGSFMPRNDMEELAKIPALIHHYLEHKAHSKTELSFAQFLKEHYSESTEHNSDKAHKNLPFFEHQCPGLVFVLPVFRFTLVEPFDFIETQYPTYEDSFCSNPSAEVWQPPQA
ncbi:MAG TPA: hypothetical protein PKY12_09130 [Catalimonadaceae bacterium]|nr:hypothetical protein [Catalimonadaceae bacterium]